MNKTEAAHAIVNLATGPVVMAIATEMGIKADDDVTAIAERIITATGTKSQMTFASLAVQMTVKRGGRILAEDLTKALARAFPEDRIGKRHGPHYLSLARHGKLPNLDKTMIPFSSRAKSTPIATAAKVVPPATASVTVEPAAPTVPVAEAVTPTEAAVAAPIDYTTMSRKDLVQAARNAGVSHKGTAEEIIARLVAKSSETASA